MKLQLSPCQGLPGQAETAISVAGDVLTVDGTAYNLASVPDGGEGWPSEGPFVGPVRRVSGVIECGVIVVLGDDAEPVQSDEPADWLVNVASGAVTIPAARIGGA